MKVYCKQPIEAEQFDGSNEMINRYGIIDAGTMPSPTIHSDQLYGPFEPSRIKKGDWIVFDPIGTHSLLDDMEFHKNYYQLPVIPKVWADTIEKYKANHYRLDEIFTEWSWNYDEQELIARAWLDGYQVEAQHDTRTD
ncbi:DUF1642 domain-containing protein [Levilactobacillus brevis]|nr:DUF1642 domain-containing protein [Levilactobacillus brevis]